MRPAGWGETSLSGSARGVPYGPSDSLPPTSGWVYLSVMNPLRTTAWLQATSGTSTITVASEVAQIVIALAMLVLVVLVAMLVFRLHRVVKELQRSAHQNFGPVSDRARSISDNVEFITQTVRSDVESLNASVRGLSERLQLASDRMEERIEDFNALMTVVQGEAEEIFLDTASTVRGVREGARAIADPAARAARRDAGDAPGSPPETGDADVLSPVPEPVEAGNDDVGVDDGPSAEGEDDR